MRRAASSWAVLLLLLAAPAMVLSANPSGEGSFRFLVSLSHSPDSCLAAIDAAKSVGDEFLAQCDWGCVGGDHTCYLIVRGDDEATVRKTIPREWAGARIVKLLRFTPEQVASFHSE